MSKLTPNKIRILRIIGQCKTGGTETIALNYYKRINHSKFAIDFLFFGDSIKRFNEELEQNGDKVINVVDYTSNLVKSILQIREVVRNGNYDIVHSQLNALNMFPLMGAFLGGASIRIAANHSTANLREETLKSIIKYLMRPTTKIFATNYAACSKYAGEWCFGRVLSRRGKIKVIHNAIDLEKFKYIPDERKNVRAEMKWNESFVVGHCGRFTEQKNHKFIVEIFNVIHKKCPNSILVLVGDGDLREDIEMLVREYKLDNCVEFLGVRFDVNKLMQGMDVFLFPSLYEGLGNVITEAQAVGLRSIVSSVVPREVKMTELVDFISLKENVNYWAEKVLTYQNGYVRCDTHEQIRSAGYDINQEVKALEEYYCGLIEVEKNE